MLAKIVRQQHRDVYLDYLFNFWQFTTISKRFVQILPRHINPKKIAKDMAKMCAAHFAFLFFFKKWANCGFSFFICVFSIKLRSK